MRPMRFPRRSLWFVVIILGIVFGLPILPLLVSFVLVEPPLQRYYLLTYVESGETAKIPGATTPVNWLYKTAPGRQRALLTEPDVVFGQNGKLPVRLSQAALKDGWTGIEESPEQRVSSAQVEQILRKDFYNGVGYRWVMAKPALICLLGFSVLIAAVIAVRRRGRAQSRHEERHGRRTKGPELVTAAEWNSKLQPDGIRFQLRGESSLLGSFSKLLPNLDSQYLAIRRNLEPNHILIMGDSGSGKTSAMRQILRQVSERQETAIVYDPALEFTPEFYSAERGDVILNPLDRRCPYWDIADESNSDDGNTAMAAALFPDKDYEKEYFTDAPRRIFTFLMRRHPSPQQLVEWMSNPVEIERMVKGTPYAAFLDPGAPAQRGGVLSSFNMIAESLEQLPSREGSRTVFSSGGWNVERRQWVFLTSRPASRQKVLPLHSAWLDMLILRTMEPSLHRTKPVWFVLDELASLNKLPQLHTAVTEARKSGNPVVLGFQGRSQLEKRYGKDAEAMLSQPATKIFLKTTEPHAAKWVSDAIGEIEVERLKESRKASLLPLNKQYTMEIATKPLVMASEIAGLEPLHGYIKQENRVASVRFPYVAVIERQPAFLERTPPPAPRPELVKALASQPASESVAATEAPKRPAKRQGLFPGASQPKVVNAEPTVWHESEWID
ncbi:MAG: type IV secretion system DNA-binding domain-containing protein [Terracidiphilus sp.]